MTSQECPNKTSSTTKTSAPNHFWFLPVNPVRPVRKKVGSYLTEFARDVASIALSSKPRMSDLGINVMYYRAAWAAK